jgi:hypothetical protein
MGFLSDASEADGGSDIETTEDTAQTVDTSAQEQTTSTQDTPPTEQKTERVALPSRRERAAQRTNEVTQQLQALQKTIGESTKQFETRMSALAEENARLRGGFEAIQQQRQAPAQQQPPQKTPDEMRREARKALDAGDFETWERMHTDAILAQVRPLIPQQQAPQAPGPSPVVQAMLMQHPGVVGAGERGIQLAIAEDNRLAALGHAPSPERFQQAFKLAEQALKPAAAPAYSQASRGALAGVPRQRDNATSQSSGDQGVVLTAYEMQVAEKCGMSKAEYAKYVAEMDPKRVTG